MGRVPEAEIHHDTGKEASLGDTCTPKQSAYWIIHDVKYPRHTENNPASNHTPVGGDSSGTHGNDTPGDHDTSDPFAWREVFEAVDMPSVSQAFIKL